MTHHPPFLSPPHDAEKRRPPPRCCRRTDGAGGGGGGAGDPLAPGQQQQHDQQQQQRQGPLTTAVFGVLYTLAKEKISDSKAVALASVVVDFLLIGGILLLPEYPWALPAGHGLQRLVFYIEFHLPIARTVGFVRTVSFLRDREFFFSLFLWGFFPRGAPQSFFGPSFS